MHAFDWEPGDPICPPWWPFYHLPWPPPPPPWEEYVTQDGIPYVIILQSFSLQPEDHTVNLVTFDVKQGNVVVATLQFGIPQALRTQWVKEDSSPDPIPAKQSSVGLQALSVLTGDDIPLCGTKPPGWHGPWPPHRFGFMDSSFMLVQLGLLHTYVTLEKGTVKNSTTVLGKVASDPMPAKSFTEMRAIYIRKLQSLRGGTRDDADPMPSPGVGIKT